MKTSAFSSFRGGMTQTTRLRGTWDRSARSLQIPDETEDEIAKGRSGVFFHGGTTLMVL
jgi:hypothetical protein